MARREPRRVGVVQLLRLIREDYYRNHERLTGPGFQAVAVHRFGAWAAQLPRPLALPLLAAHAVLYVFVRNVYGIELPRTTKVGRRLRISHQSGVVIHPDAVIGDDCIIRQNVTIGGVNAGRAELAPTLGDNVEIGAGAALIGRITVGDGVRIGPNVVLTMSVPAGARVFAPAPRVLHATPAAPRPAAAQPADAALPEPVVVAADAPPASGNGTPAPRDGANGEVDDMRLPLQ